MYWRGDILGAAMLQEFKGKVVRTYPNIGGKEKEYLSHIYE